MENIWKEKRRKKKVKERLIKTVIYCDEVKKPEGLKLEAERAGVKKKKKEVGPIEEGKSKIIGLR